MFRCFVILIVLSLQYCQLFESWSIKKNVKNSWNKKEVSLPSRDFHYSRTPQDSGRKWLFLLVHLRFLPPANVTFYRAFMTLGKKKNSKAINEGGIIAGGRSLPLETRRNLSSPNHNFRLSARHLRKESFPFNFFLFSLNQAVGVGVHFKRICFLPDECLPRQEDIKHSLDGNFHLSLRSWRLALPPVTQKIDWRKDLKRNEWGSDFY